MFLGERLEMTIQYEISVLVSEVLSVLASVVILNSWKIEVE